MSRTDTLTNEPHLARLIAEATDYVKAPDGSSGMFVNLDDVQIARIDDLAKQGLRERVAVLPDDKRLGVTPRGYRVRAAEEW